jgi:hypothetical protein
MPVQPHHRRTIEIRKLTEAERPAMASSVRDLARRPHVRGAPAAGIERIAERLAEPASEREFLVAADGSRPLGIACFAMPHPAGAARPQLLLHEICVAADGPDADGIGHALLRALVRLAIARGCAGVDLGTAAVPDAPGMRPALPAAAEA